MDSIKSLCQRNGVLCRSALVGLCAISVYLLSPSAIAAQSLGGEIRGRISDSKGGLLGGVSLAIENIETGTIRSTTTNREGTYDVPNLPVGLYLLTATYPGFAAKTQSNIRLDVSVAVDIDIQMAVGQITNTINVNSQTTAIDIVASHRDAVDGGELIKSLPLNGRDWTSLAALQPGVSTLETENQPNLDVLRGNRGYDTMLTISGERPQQSSFWVNGIDVNDYSGGGPGSVLGGSLGVDALEEFTVITANPPAEYGRTSAGAINAVTTEGTDHIHGSAYEFLRNSALDARNYFDGKSKPPFRRNQFGASLGGPIRRNQTFGFANYEGIRQSLGVTTVNSVPSPNAHLGQLTTGTVSVDPKIMPYLSLFPLPNGAIVGDVGSFSFAGQEVSNENFVVGRLNHHFTTNNEIGGFYLYDQSSTIGPDTFDGVLLGTLARRQTGGVEETHVLSPAAVNIVRLGFNRVVANQVRSISAINAMAADPSLGFIPGRNVGEITVPGLTQYPGGVGASGDYQFHYTSMQFYDDVTFILGVHSLKAGASTEVVQSNSIGAGTNNGNASFGSLAGFLTNTPTAFSATLPGTNVGLGLRQWIVGAYVEDAWRVTPRFTVNLGLRYETATVPEEQQGRLSSLMTGSQTLRRGAIFSNPTFLNFAPRAGLSWDVFGHQATVFKAAIGQYDSLPLTNHLSLISVLSAPFTIQGTSTSVPQGSFPDGLYGSLAAGGPRAEFIQQNPSRNYVLQWNASISQQLAPNLILDIGYVGAHGVHQPLIENDINTTPPASVANGAFVWPTPVGSGVKPWPQWGNVTAVMWVASSTYNAMQLTLRKQFDHGLQAQAAYTWSKSLDIGSNSLPTAYTNTVSNLPYFAPALLRSYSDFDQPQSLVLSGSWQVPVRNGLPQPMAWALSGWQIGGLASVHSGVPFTVTIAGDPLGLRTSIPYDFPDRVSSSTCKNPVNAGNVAHYIKLACFAAPTPSTRLGDSGRNSARGPGLADWDSSLFKNIALPKAAERVNLQFRFEAFNLLNRSNFEPPPASSNQLFNQSLAAISSAGSLTSTTTSSRQLQFGLKLRW